MFADIVWPALYLISRLLSIWVIGSGLLIEFFFLWRFMGITAKRALLADVLMNLASATGGILLIMLVGFAVVLPFEQTFCGGAWLVTFVAAVFVNASLESLIVSRWFKSDFRQGDFWLLVVGNAVTVGMAYGSLALFPDKA